MDARQRQLVGPALTLILLVLTETVAHGLGQSELGVTLLLLCLAPIAYAGLRAGFTNALVCTSAVALYTLHYIAPHEAIARFDAQGWVSFAIMLVLGVGMGWPMSRVRAREERLYQELAQRAADLEARNRELTNANASLEAFGYVVSHDLKEPVRALENYLDAAKEEWPGEESRMYLDEAYEANRRLTRLLEGLLAYSRTSSFTAEPHPVPLHEVLTSSACTAQYAPKQAERAAHVEIAPDLPVVLGDRTILAQLFGNLLLNALRHHPRSGGRVRVLALPTEDAGRAHLVVEDDGAGYPPDVLARFTRMHSDRPATIKSGFGLAIAHRAAQRMGGKLWLENGPQGGARAHVELPTPLSEVRNGRSAPPHRDDPTRRVASST